MLTMVPRMVIVFEACNSNSYHHCDNTLKMRSKCNQSIWALRATSHMRLKAYDRCILRSLIGRDCASLLHSRKGRFKDPKKSSWMKSLREFLHDKLFTGCLNLHQTTSTNSNRLCHLNHWYSLWMRVTSPRNYTVSALGSRVKWPLVRPKNPKSVTPKRLISSSNSLGLI
jgi:hypothetical protein